MTPARSGTRPSLCIINYNGARVLGETLASVLPRRQAFAEVLVVDNASSDGSLELVRDRLPEVRVLRLDENRGPAAARNAGYRAAASDLILFLDNDVSLAEGCPDRLLEELSTNPRAAAAMPRVLYARNPDTIQYDGAESHFLGLMTLLNADRPLAGAGERTREMGSVVTACFLVDRRRWGADDPFDEAFLFNYEDHDFGLRTRIRGHAILGVPSARCRHGEGTPGLSLRPGGAYSRLRVFCLIRNRWQILLKDYAVRTLVLLSPALALYEILQLAGAVRRGWIGEWMRASRWMALHAGDVLRRRRAVQASRRIRDREILCGGPVPFTRELTRNPLEQAVKAVLDRLASGYWTLVRRLL